MSQIRTYNTVVLAGAEVEIAAKGDFVYINESSGMLEIKANGLNFKAYEGQGARAISGFNTLNLKNSSALDIEVMLTIGSGEFTDNRISGSIAIKASRKFINYDDKTVLTLSTSILLNEQPTRGEAFIQSLSSNTGNVRIGLDVSATKGFILKPGESMILSVSGEIKCFNAGAASAVLAVNEVIE